MSKLMACSCKKEQSLVDVTNDYRRFVERLDLLEVGDWVKLMRCPMCGQLWRVDEWDKYQTSYAAKISSQADWREVDLTRQVKELMVQNRGGLESFKCIKNCEKSAVKGSVYCVDHLYETGARA